jgi:hypothetical protein
MRVDPRRSDEHTITGRAEGPLAVHTEPVRAAPVESGYASGTVVAHPGLLRPLDARCMREHVDAADLTDAGIEGLLTGVVVAGRSTRTTALPRRDRTSHQPNDELLVFLEGL